VGGDYYDYTLADDGTLTFTLGDATGHGMVAGVVVTATKTLFQSLAHQPNIVETFTAMSRNLKNLNLKRIGMAMNMIKDYTMHVSSAGIPPMLLYRAATQTIQEILIPGMPLGYSATAQYEQQTFDLAPGDTLLLMSDGLPERLNTANEEYGYPAVEALFAEVATEAPDAIIQRLTQGGETWANGRPQDDDITLVVLKIKD
jgi:serine phosphatase RsbU (regulator of sigma subunit)